MLTVNEQWIREQVAGNVKTWRFYFSFRRGLLFEDSSFVEPAVFGHRKGAGHPLVLQAWEPDLES